MKYMTPELMVRFRSTDDSVADAASAEWGRACADYEKHLQEIAPMLMKSTRRLLKQYDLHDAKVLSMATDDVPYFSIRLELNNPSDSRNEQLELRYRLVGGVGKGLNLIKHDTLAGDGKPMGWWLYDEIDVTGGVVSAVTHSILLTGGYEFQLTFFSLVCRRANVIFPPLNDDGVIDVKEMDRIVRRPA